MDPSKQATHNWPDFFFWGYIILALSGFIALAVQAYYNPYLPFDPAISLWLQSFHPAWFSTLMVVISWPGYMPEAGLIVAAILVLAYFVKYHLEALLLAMVAITSEILNFAVKTIVHQPRPSPDLIHVVKILTSYNFPSGHVMFFTSFFAFLWFLIYRLCHPSWQRTAFLVILGLMVALVGISRIFLGAHWFSDVLGAYLLGGAILLVSIRIYNQNKLPSRR